MEQSANDSQKFQHLVKLQICFEVSLVYLTIFSWLHQQLGSVTAPLNRFYVLWRHKNHRRIIIIITIIKARLPTVKRCTRHGKSSRPWPLPSPLGKMAVKTETGEERLPSAQLIFAPFLYALTVIFPAQLQKNTEERMSIVFAFVSGWSILRSA